MKATFLICICTIICTYSNAQSQGPFSGTSFTNVSIPGSVATWSNTSNAGKSDDMYTSFGDISGGPGSYTDYLVVTGFKFIIPLATTITGIVVEVEESDRNLLTSDYSVRLTKNNDAGTFEIGSTEKAMGNAYPATDSYQVYGSNEDLWGEIWTPENINNTSFGVAIAAQRNADGDITAGAIDHVRITVYYTFIVLPVNLISFTAVKGNNAVHLNWTTTGETNMNHYEVERSADGSSFSSLTSIPSRNFSTSSLYTFNDNSPVKAVSYYRLKMISNTGTAKYSDIISVHFNGTGTVDLYPNPLLQGQTLYINNEDKEQLIIQFFDMPGKRLSSVETTSNQVPLLLPEHMKGILFYRVANRNGEITGTGKLVLK